MRARRTVMILAVVGMVMGVMAPVSAGGRTASQMERAGYGCLNLGPHNWTHCSKAKPSAQSITNMVFSEDGMTFLGTEQLLHDDIYAGQPCPQDDDNAATGFGEHWIDLSGPFPLPGIPYWACHRFDAS